MKIVLLNMPISGIVSNNYPSTSYLAGAVKAAGHEVVQRDLNLDGYDYLMTESFLHPMVHKFHDKYLSKDNGNPGSLSALHLQNIYDRSVKTVSQVSRAKEILKNPDTFYDINSYEQAAVILATCTNLISKTVSPLQLTHGAYYPAGDITKSSTFDDCGEKPEENIYYEYLLHDVIPWIASHNPKIIGISITFAGQLLTGIHLASLIRRSKGINAHLVAGGGELSAIGHKITSDFFLFRYFDSLIVRDGETPLRELADCLEEKPGAKPMNVIPNIIYLQDGRIVRGPYFQEDLSTLQPPDFTLVRDWPILAPYPVYLTVPSRGCFGKCAFCNSAFYNRDGEGGRPYRILDIDRLMAHFAVIMALQPEDEITYIYFADESTSPYLLNRISERIIKEGFHHKLRWICNARLDKGFTPKACETIYNAGCRQIFFGMESGCQRILDLMEKGTRLDSMSQALKSTSQAGIANFLSIIIGFPGEKAEEAEETLRFVVSHKDYIFTAQFCGYGMVIYSKVWANPEKYGILLDSQDGGDLLSWAVKYRVKEGMKGLEALRSLYSIQERFHMHRPFLSVIPGYVLGFGGTTLLYLERYGKDRLLAMAKRKGKYKGNLFF